MAARRERNGVADREPRFHFDVIGGSDAQDALARDDGFADPFRWVVKKRDALHRRDHVRAHLDVLYAFS